MKCAVAAEASNRAAHAVHVRHVGQVTDAAATVAAVVGGGVERRDRGLRWRVGARGGRYRAYIAVVDTSVLQKRRKFI